MPSVEFNNLDNEDLENIANQIKSIQNSRNKLFRNSLIKENLAGLQESLMHTKEKKIPDAMLEYLNFENIKNETIDFYLYLLEMPQFKEDKKYVDDTVCASFRDIKVYSKIKNNYWKEIKLNAKGLMFEVETDIKVLEDLVKEKLIVPSYDLLPQALEKNAFNFIEFGFNNNLFITPEKNSEQLYAKCIFLLPLKLISYADKMFPHGKDLSLDELIDNFNLPNIHTPTKKLNHLVYAKPDIFTHILQTYDFSSQFVYDMLMPLNGSLKVKTIKIFMEIIAEKCPHNLKIIEDNGKKLNNILYKPMLDKVLLNLSLQDLPEKAEPSKKAKI